MRKNLDKPGLDAPVYPGFLISRVPCGFPFGRIYTGTALLCKPAARQRDIPVSGPVLCKGTLNQLDDLHNGDDADRKRKRDQILMQADAGKAECIGEEGDLADNSGGNQAAERRPVEGLVHIVHPEQAAALRAHVEAVEYLGMLMVTKAMVVPSRAVGDLPDAGLDKMPDKVAHQGQDRDQQALIGDIEAHAAGKDAGPWRRAACAA